MNVKFSEKQVALLGWIATAITISSFAVPDDWLRIINLGGCFTWIVYGLLRKEKPVIATNFMIAAIHLYKLFL